MSSRASPPGRPADRWDRDRYEYERDRIERDDDRYVRRPSSRLAPSRPPDDRRDDDSDVVVRERRRVVYRDSSPGPVPRRAPSPPAEVERSRVTVERERYRSRSRSRSPSPRPPRLVRRQSSLDTFDRRPPRRYWETEDRARSPPPAPRREEYRSSTYVDVAPPPKSDTLPPARTYAAKRYYDEPRRTEYYDEIQISDPYRYGDDDFHAYRDRLRETEVVRTTTRRSRSRSRERRRPRSRSSSSSSSSRSRGRSEYPKKGKTRIPARLVSRRALYDLGYPFVEEGSTIVVQLALGQQNIEDLIKLSADYKKSDVEVRTSRPSTGNVVEERIERRTEVYDRAPAVYEASPVVYEPRPVVSKPPPAPYPPANSSGPIIIQADPPPRRSRSRSRSPSPLEVVRKTTTVVREEVSPVRYTTRSSSHHRSHERSYDTFDAASTSSYTTRTSASRRRDHSPHTPTVVREVSSQIPVGPVALAATSSSTTRHHSRHRAYDTEDLRAEIRHLEREVARREQGVVGVEEGESEVVRVRRRSRSRHHHHRHRHYRHHHHHHPHRRRHRSRSRSSSSSSSSSSGSSRRRRRRRSLSVASVRSSYSVGSVGSVESFHSMCSGCELCRGEDVWSDLEGTRRRRRERRLSNGDVVLYEEEVFREPRTSGGVRIERDRRGRLAFKVPKR